MTDDLTIPPPGNDQAEQSVLGSLLRDNACIGDVLQVLRVSHFRTDRHQLVFAAVVALYDRRVAVDAVTLGEELVRRRRVEDLGPARLGYLAELWDAAPTAANVLHYAGIVREHAIVRSLFHAGQQIAADAKARPASADDLLEQAEKRVFAIAEMGVTGQAYPLREVVAEAVRILDAKVAVARQSGVAAGGLQTGFPDLDTVLSGGMPPGSLVVVGARPSCGKTAIGLCVARNVALRGEPVLFVSLEQSRLELADRLIAAQAEVDSYALRSGSITDDDVRKVQDARSVLQEGFMFIDDSPGQTMLRIAANARRMKLRHNIALVVVDYLQLVEGDNRAVNRQEQVSGISRKLKDLARELNVPVVALAQLNREVERRGGDGRPQLADLRDSGAIEQDADIVILLHRLDAEDAADPVVELLLKKNRNGPTDVVRLVFQKRFVRFANLARGTPQF